MRMGFGVAAGTSADLLTGLAEALQRLGYEDVWANDLPGADGLDTLTVLGAAGPVLRLGLGVAPLDRRPALALGEAVASSALQADSLVLGVGAGFSPRPVPLIREGVAALRGLLPQVRLAVAAMGPGMCRLAGELAADAVLLNWMVPERIGWARRLVAEGATAAGRDPGQIEVAGYVRVAMGSDARERLAREARGYARMAHYGRHFQAMGAPPEEIGVAAGSAGGIRNGLAPYRSALDTAVVRALPAMDAVESYLEIAEAAGST